MAAVMVTSPVIMAIISALEDLVFTMIPVLLSSMVNFEKVFSGIFTSGLPIPAVRGNTDRFKLSHSENEISLLGLSIFLEISIVNKLTGIWKSQMAMIFPKEVKYPCVI